MTTVFLHVLNHIFVSDFSHNELDHSRMSLDKSIHESSVSNQEEMLEVRLTSVFQPFLSALPYLFPCL